MRPLVLSAFQRLGWGMLIAMATTLMAPTAEAQQQSLRDFVSAQVLAGRYMSAGQSCGPSPQDVYGWQREKLRRCVYEVNDRLPNGARRAKRGIVYLADPPAADVLNWLESACRRASPSNVDRCVREEAVQIRQASGAQFPVAGLVWEDMDGDGVSNGFVFRNGVTVRVVGFSNSSTTPPADDQELEALATRQTVRGIHPTGGYARVASTSRAEFARLTQRTDIPVGKQDAASALFWSDLVGAEHRAAFGASSNALITAKACARRGFPQTCSTN